jgi:hypothetical protein
MTGRMKLLLVLLVGGGAGFLLFRTSERAWGSNLKAAIARPYRASPIRVGDVHTFRAELSLPPGTVAGNEIEVPENVFEKLLAADVYERRMRALPFLGLQGFEHRVTRGAETVAEWEEGHTVLYGAIGVLGLAAGAVAAALAAIALSALGIGKAPNV